MNLLDILVQHLNPVSKDVATVTGIKANGQLIASTLGGGTVVLIPNGVVDVGQQVYYNRANNHMVAVAPKIHFKKWGV